MSKVKRLRIFAGPNGSGKSTLYEAFCENYNAGYFVNSDIIEKEITEKGFIDLARFNLTSDQKELDSFLKTDNAISLLKKSESQGQIIDIEIKENIFVDKSRNTHSYEASLISSFIRWKLIESNHSFSYETVMSHQSKIEEIVEAKRHFYKVYLYFICLDDPDLNVSRVKNRVIKGGHAVDDHKIIERYSKTLENLLAAIKVSDRSFLFDNSNKMVLIAEVLNGQIILHKDEEFLPNWFIKYIINKIY